MTLVRDLRRVAVARERERPPRPVERCDLCGARLAPDHRHLLQLEQRQILCACEACFALRAGDRELRPTGRRVVWLDDFRLPDELWAGFRIPIGLAFLFESGTTGVTALYPSPAGATESELALDAWSELVALNPVLATLEQDTEALIVNRLVEPHQHVLAPIDRCYALVGLVKLRWQGISGGDGLRGAVHAFLDELRTDTA